MSDMEVDEAAIIVMREYLQVGDYDEHFFEKVEQLLSIFRGDVVDSTSKSIEEPLKEIQIPKKVNPFKNYRI